MWGSIPEEHGWDHKKHGDDDDDHDHHKWK